MFTQGWNATLTNYGFVVLIGWCATLIIASCDHDDLMMYGYCNEEIVTFNDCDDQ